MYEAELIPLNTPLEAVAITINSDIKISICNIYIPPSENFSTAVIEELLQQIPSPRILLGDFNSHSPYWGSKFRSLKGKVLEQLLDSNNINILNTGEPTRFNIQTGESSVIYLSMCDPVLQTSLNWEVHPYLYGSDHFPILITRPFKTALTTPLSKWKLDQANWTLFSDQIDQKLPYLPDPSTSNISSTYLKFSELILEAGHKAVGKTKTLKTHTSVPWWNTKCDEAIKKYKRAFNKFRRCPTTQNQIKYKKLRAESRYQIKQTKKQNWKSFVASINNSTPLSALWRKIRQLSGKQQNAQISFLKHNDQFITSTQEITEIFADLYEQNSSTNNYSSNFLQFKFINEKKEIMITENTEDYMNSANFT
ncbi:uncharacterized protein [Diabrotica undecimpunctata]|uniref:uncharacterized protein n=1 Tax=Diabrotica undecimpunctata TaxID=50387 RepID=UPI003B63303A